MQMLFKLNKPDISSIDVPTVLDKFLKADDSVLAAWSKSSTPVYLYWDKIRYQDLPSDFSAKELWAVIKLFRKSSPGRIQSVVKSEDGQYFSWDSLPSWERILHECDMKLGESMLILRDTDTYEKRKIILSGVMEEAIASSQLEGANTTRKAGKEMLRTRRKPRTEAERMIVNNFRVMQELESDYGNNDLDIDLLFKLHATITKETIKESDIGRLRVDNDRIQVVGKQDENIYHIPPKEQFLKEEIGRLIAFFNDGLLTGQFIHPIIKATIIHFWIGYLHPFTDGNGRLARALFYWYLLRKKYRAFTYMPLSTVIRKSPGKYRDAFVYTEQDDNDLNYFIDYNMRMIVRAVEEFDAYIKKQTIDRKLHPPGESKFDLNRRQLELLRHYQKNLDATTTIETYARVSEVSRLTARNDLIRLKKMGFVTSRKVGREVLYSATEKIQELLVE